MANRLHGLGSGAGPTGEFPDAKIRDDDGGELKVGYAADHKRNLILIDFGTPVAWLALSPDGAREFAASLVRKAAEVEGVNP